jgi:orotate phosphoribosyltransferase-like protein
MSSNLNERQQLAVVLLCSGLSATEVAKELKVRKETISRWKNDHEFNEELRSWRLAFFDRLIKRQFALFSEAQDQIEAAFQDNALTSYQKANIALRFVSMFSGNMNVNKQLASKRSDLYFKDDKWFI